MQATSFEEALGFAQGYRGQGYANAYGPHALTTGIVAAYTGTNPGGAGGPFGGFLGTALAGPTDPVPPEVVREIARTKMGAALPESATLTPGKAYVLGYEVEGRGDELVSSIADFRAGLAQRGLVTLGVAHEATFSASRNLTTARFWYVVTPKSNPQAIVPLVIGVALVVGFVAQWAAGRAFGFKRGFIGEALVDSASAVGEAAGTAARGAGEGAAEGAGAILKAVAVPVIAVAAALGLILYLNRGTAAEVARAASPL